MVEAEVIVVGIVVQCYREILAQRGETNTLVCMGPCSQKLLEHNWTWSRDICSLRSIDTSLQDYLVTDFWVESMVEKYNG
jgi:hypothetical protein